MLWSSKMYYINTLKQDIGMLKLMSIMCLIRGLTMIGTSVILLLSLVCMLVRIIANFLPNLHRRPLLVTCIVYSSS